MAAKRGGCAQAQNGGRWSLPIPTAMSNHKVRLDRAAGCPALAARDPSHRVAVLWHGEGKHLKDEAIVSFPSCTHPRVPYASVHR